MNALPFALLKIGDDEYSLKLTAKNSILLEEKLGTSIVQGLSKLDRISVAVDYLHAALQATHPCTEDEACQIFDDYTSTGHSLADFADVITEVLIVSGFLTRAAVEEARKNQKLLEEKAKAMMENKLKLQQD